MSALANFRTSTRLVTGFVRRNPERPLRQLLCAIPFATMLATMAGGSAFAQSCTGQCALQAADQEVLLSPFNALKSSPEGQAVLDKNLQVENDIYRYSTQDQKIASGTILIVPLIPANVLIRAFPGNSNFYYTLRVCRLRLLSRRPSQPWWET